MKGKKKGDGEILGVHDLGRVGGGHAADADTPENGEQDDYEGEDEQDEKGENARAIHCEPLDGCRKRAHSWRWVRSRLGDGQVSTKGIFNGVTSGKKT